MQLWDRLVYAFISALFGAAIGTAGWWLYGMAHSLNYDGPSMDPVLRHWLLSSIALFGVLGFIFQQMAADFAGDTISAILHFEFNDTPGNGTRWFVALVFVAICIAAIWFTTPHGK